MQSHWVFTGQAALADQAGSGDDPVTGYTVWQASKSPPQRICNSSAIRGERLARIRSNTRGCGVTSPVRVHQVSGVALSPPAIMDCRTARSLRKWVRRGPKRTLGNLGGGLV